MSLRIVCLDGYTLNPGDIDWKGFEAQGEITVHDRSAANEIVSRAKGAPVVLTNKTPLTAATLEQLPDLKYIGVLATGYNIVDVKAAKARGITVTNIPTYGTDSVAQHAAALLLELARGVSRHDRAVHDGQWVRCKDFCFAASPIFELTGKTLGLVGMGRIGTAFARIAAAMGMRLLTVDRRYPSPDLLQGLKLTPVAMDDLFRQSDVVSLHCPLTDETKHLVNGPRLKMMKKSAFLINTSRGPLIDNQALADALRQGVIAGAALDVLDVEPPPANNPLLSAPNCIITPHVAWYALEARRRLMDTAASNLQSFLAGKPVNVVS